MVVASSQRINIHVAFQRLAIDDYVEHILPGGCGYVIRKVDCNLHPTKLLQWVIYEHAGMQQKCKFCSCATPIQRECCSVKGQCMQHRAHTSARQPLMLRDFGNKIENSDRALRGQDSVPSNKCSSSRWCQCQRWCRQGCSPSQKLHTKEKLLSALFHMDACAMHVPALNSIDNDCRAPHKTN